jgi:hypothetical protein
MKSLESDAPRRTSEENDDKERGEGHKGHKCSICGKSYDTVAFKSGYVCEDCIGYVKKHA